MNYKKILLSILCFAFTLNAQIPNIKKISVQDSTRNIVASSVVSGVGNNLFFFWADSNLLYSAYTSDYGETWSIPTVIADDVKSIRSEPEIRTLKLASGRILLIYKATRHFLIYSDDSGLSWSSKIELPTSTSIQSQYVATPHLTQFDDGRIVFAYSLLFPSGSYRNQAYLIESLDGTIWTERDTIVSSTKRVGAPTLVSINSEKLLLAYQEMDAANKFEIRLKNSNDSGKTWSGGDIIVTDKYKVKQPQLIKDDAGTIWLFYLSLNSLPFESYWKSGFLQSDINFIKSSDAGNSWTSPEKFTEHLLDDEKFHVSLIDGKLFITFSSVRPNEYLAKSLDPHFGFAVNEHPYQVYFGIGGESSDDQTPPVIFEGELEFTGNYPIIDITAKVKIPDDNIKTAAFNFKLNDGIEETILLNDAGIEGDLIATDYTYSGKLSASGFQYIDFYFSVENESGIKSKTETMRSIGTPDVLAKSYLVNVNKFMLPLWYNGTLADAEVMFPDSLFRAGGYFDDISFLYSAGFFMSGKNGNDLWSANQFSVSRFGDFINGKVGSQSDNFYSRFFSLKSYDPHFSESWKQWGFAVEQGADFYDGDFDGQYSPIDKNNNGTWDLDEDKPIFIGDESAWCVFNDGIPQENRRFNNNPMGIEIQQTVFGYSPETYKELENVLFVKYRIINTGSVSNVLDSVIFSAAADPDIGNYENDLMGCDVIRNSGFGYDQGIDQVYQNSPAFFITLVQGAKSYIPGKTFADNNSNSLFDDGIDTPMDTAFHFQGKEFPFDSFAGATNIGMTSFFSYFSSDPVQGDPSTIDDLRNYQRGLGRSGEHIDPCTAGYSYVAGGIDCNSIDPHYLYSGDPVTQTGWLFDMKYDVRFSVNSGYFTLKKDEPIEIIYAYLVGRGATSIESITEARKIADVATNFYRTNFSEIVVDVEEQSSIIPKEFSLYQNYPNPFNPRTVIKFHVPSSKFVKLLVFDILGREVKTLVNEYKTPGIYEFSFDASLLASGLYFYQLTAGSFSQTKKMMLLK